MIRLLDECTDYDFKEMLEEKKPKSWLKSVSAFANGIGGSLFFGIADENNIVGIKNAKDDISKISDFIKTRIEPVPIFRAISHDIGGKIVVEVQISKGQFTPYYYSADGNKIAYIRSGNQTIPAPSYILNELILKGLGQTYDAILTNENKDDYSFTYLTSKYLSRTKLRFEREDFESFELSSNGFLTRAGILFADENHVRQSRIFCTRWNGVNKVSEETVLADLEISGSLLVQLDRALNFFEDNTRVPWRKENGDTIYKYGYDYEAIKEALVNAIVHRDYNVVGSEVVLNIYNDRIEITSPGGMYSGKIIPNVVESVMESKRRNPVVADLFHRMKLMNRRGSGLANITNRTNALFNDNLNHVRYRSDEEFFVVTIENALFGFDGDTEKNSKRDVAAETDSGLTKGDRNVLETIRKNKNITVLQIADLTNLSKSTVLRAIKKLTEFNIIKRAGDNRKGFWQIL